MCHCRVELGIKFLDLCLLACQTLVKGLVDVGIMKDYLQDVVDLGVPVIFSIWVGSYDGVKCTLLENFDEAYVGFDDQKEKSNACGLKSLPLGKELASGYVVIAEFGIYFIHELFKKHKL